MYKDREWLTCEFMKACHVEKLCWGAAPPNKKMSATVGTVSQKPPNTVQHPQRQPTHVSRAGMVVQASRVKHHFPGQEMWKLYTILIVPMAMVHNHFAACHCMSLKLWETKSKRKVQHMCTSLYLPWSSVTSCLSASSKHDKTPSRHRIVGHPEVGSTLTPAYPAWATNQARAASCPLLPGQNGGKASKKCLTKLYLQSREERNVKKKHPKTSFSDKVTLRLQTLGQKSTARFRPGWKWSISTSASSAETIGNLAKTNCNCCDLICFPLKEEEMWHITCHNKPNPLYSLYSCQILSNFRLMVTTGRNLWWDSGACWQNATALTSKR